MDCLWKSEGQKSAENNKNKIFGIILDMYAKSLDGEPRQYKLPARQEQGAEPTTDNSAGKVSGTHLGT